MKKTCKEFNIKQNEVQIHKDIANQSNLPAGVLYKAKVVKEH